MSFTLNFNGTILFTEAEFTALNPILPPNVMAFSSDTGNIKIGDGETAWFDLPSLGGQVEQTIGGKAISDTTPSANSLMYLCGASNQWKFRTWGCMETESNWTGYYSTIFDSYTLLIELDDATQIPTGRIKIGDGITQFSSLPWLGDLVIEDIADGEGIAWDALNEEWTYCAFASTDDITYEWLDTNGDVGTSAGTLAIGNHTHAHNNTTSLQGGTTNEYYHLTLDEHENFVVIDDITFESLSANGAVGTSEGQLAEGDHLHSHQTLEYLQGGDPISEEYYHLDLDTYTNVATTGDIDNAIEELTQIEELTHNELNTIQGGNGSDEYYHLDLDTYTNVATTGDIDSAIEVVETTISELTHNELGMLQGGNSSDEYYHLDLDTYTDVATTGDITYESLDTNGDIGTGSNQLISANDALALIFAFGG